MLGGRTVVLTQRINQIATMGRPLRLHTVPLQFIGKCPNPNFIKPLLMHNFSNVDAAPWPILYSIGLLLEDECATYYSGLKKGGL